MMLDELKYLLSTAVLQALGTVRDKGCHIILAHQANDDLKDCGGLDPNAVRGEVIVNTGLKLIYRSSDPQTLQWASDLSGTIVAKQQSSHMSQTMFESAQGQYRDVERNYITKNEILAMPKQTGMLTSRNRGWNKPEQLWIQSKCARRSLSGNPAQQGVPTIVIGGGPSLGLPLLTYDRHETIPQVRESFAFVHGRHIVKFGGDYQITEFNQDLSSVASNGFFSSPGLKPETLLRTFCSVLLPSSWKRLRLTALSVRTIWGSSGRI